MQIFLRANLNIIILRTIRIKFIFFFLNTRHAMVEGHTVVAKDGRLISLFHCHPPDDKIVRN